MFIYTLYTLTGETLGQTPLLESRPCAPPEPMPLSAGCPVW